MFDLFVNKEKIVIHKKYCFLASVLILIVFSLQAKKKIYISTGIPGYWGSSLFDRYGNNDGHLEPTYQLKEFLAGKGYEVIEPYSVECIEDDADIVVLFDLPYSYASWDRIIQLKEIKKIKLLLFLWEPPSVMPYEYQSSCHVFFDKVYTWSDLLVDNKKYFKFYYPRLNPMVQDIPSFIDKKLCVMIVTNKNSNHENELYSERRKIINFFQVNTPDDFDLYGRGWGEYLYTCYRGEIVKKVDILRHYRFSICYENVKNIAGYVTEKIFDSFRAGCVPVYWGAPNIHETIPSDCFIDRSRFVDEQQLYNFMKNMSEQEYNRYLQKIARYLQSPQAQLYGNDHFITTFLQAIDHQD